MCSGIGQSPEYFPFSKSRINKRGHGPLVPPPPPVATPVVMTIGFRNIYRAKKNEVRGLLGVIWLYVIICIKCFDSEIRQDLCFMNHLFHISAQWYFKKNFSWTYLLQRLWSTYAASHHYNLVKHCPLLPKTWIHTQCEFHSECVQALLRKYSSEWQSVNN